MLLILAFIQHRTEESIAVEHVISKMEQQMNVLKPDQLQIMLHQNRYHCLSVRTLYSAPFVRQTRGL